MPKYLDQAGLAKLTDKIHQNLASKNELNNLGDAHTVLENAHAALTTRVTNAESHSTTIHRKLNTVKNITPYSLQMRITSEGLLQAKLSHFEDLERYDLANSEEKNCRDRLVLLRYRNHQWNRWTAFSFDVTDREDIVNSSVSDLNHIGTEEGINAVYYDYDQQARWLNVDITAKYGDPLTPKSISTPIVKQAFFYGLVEVSEYVLRFRGQGTGTNGLDNPKDYTNMFRHLKHRPLAFAIQRTNIINGETRTQIVSNIVPCTVMLRTFTHADYPPKNTDNLGKIFVTYDHGATRYYLLSSKVDLASMMDTFTSKDWAHFPFLTIRFTP